MRFLARECAANLLHSMCASNQALSKWQRSRHVTSCLVCAGHSSLDHQSCVTGLITPCTDHVPICRSKSQLMVSAVWEPSSSRSKLVSNVTPKRLWGREGSVPLSLSICLTMCLVPESAAPEPASFAAPSPTSAANRQTLLPYASSVSDYQSVYSQSVYGAAGSVAGSSNAGGMAAASGSRFGRLEPVWVNSELTMRMVPTNTSFKYVRAFR